MLLRVTPKTRGKAAADENLAVWLHGDGGNIGADG